MKNINRNQGFTLVEIVITILVVGIISAVAIPSLKGFFADIKLNAATEEIATAIWYARNLAVKEEKEHRVTFSASENNFKVQRKEGVLIWSTVLNSFDKKDYMLDFDIDRHVKGVNIINANFGGITSVTFGSDVADPGRPADCGAVIIEYDNLKRIVTVSPITGRVKAGDLLIETGVVLSSSSPTQFTTDLTQSADDYFNGYTIIMTSGSNDCYAGEIIAYNGTTKEVTVDPGLSSIPVVGDTFAIAIF
ncbi:MAG: Tfp pilus assembly protein FimT/FimU [Nitrospinota bacterium]